MNARVIGLLAREELRWPLAGDQLYVDFDLSASNIPTGNATRDWRGGARSARSTHTGCKKFAERFGVGSVEFMIRPKRKKCNCAGLIRK